MSYAARTSRYVENDVLTRSPEWLVPLLYEQLLASLRRAVVHIEDGDIEARAQSLSRASEIVGELLASLDVEKGGALARELSGLYVFIATELLGAGRDGTPGPLPRLIALVDELREAWAEAAQRIAPQRPARPTAVDAA